MPAGRAYAVVFAVCVLSLAAACGGSGSPPVLPEPPPAPPAPVLPEPAPKPVGCGLPPGEGTGQCPRQRPAYDHEMNHAIARVVHEHPEYFDLSQQESTWSYLVRQPNLYLAAVVKNLEDMGFCARFDGAEIAVKKTNDFSEQYDIFTSKGFSRWGGGAYAATCRPAWF
jgi:hypothetical protein